MLEFKSSSNSRKPWSLVSEFNCPFQLDSSERSNFIIPCLVHSAMHHASPNSRTLETESQYWIKIEWLSISDVRLVGIKTKPEAYISQWNLMCVHVCMELRRVIKFKSEFQMWFYVCANFEGSGANVNKVTVCLRLSWTSLGRFAFTINRFKAF